MKTKTPRAILVQKAKTLGIKNIGKKNMVLLRKQITQRQQSGMVAPRKPESRSILVQKAKALGIKNIGKKNMVLLRKQITQKKFASVQIQKYGVPDTKKKNVTSSQNQMTPSANLHLKLCYYDPAISDYKKDELNMLAKSCGMKTSVMKIKGLHDVLRKTYDSQFPTLSDSGRSRYLKIARLRHESWQWHTAFMKAHPLLDYLSIKSNLMLEPFYKQLVQIDSDYPHA